MAGLGWKAWTREKLSAAAFQGYVQDQVVQRWASAAARNAALPTPSEGMVCYLADVDRFEYRRPDGTWKPYLAGKAPTFQGYATGVQTGLTGWQDVRLDAENYDSHDGHKSTDLFAYVIPETGLYGLEGIVAFEQIASNPARSARITVNGTVLPNAAGGEGSHGTVHCAAATGRKLWALTAGAVIRLQGWSSATWITRADTASGLTSALTVERIIGG